LPQATMQLRIASQRVGALAPHREVSKDAQPRQVAVGLRDAAQGLSGDNGKSCCAGLTEIV
jgi:hypothetical protein